MKKTIVTALLTIIMMLIVTPVQAKDKIIERPAFRAETSSDLCPVKVELTKKATIVHFHVNCRFRAWNMQGAYLECNGKTFAYQSGRIITHDGADVLSDEPFELMKEYDNALSDSLILMFDPLPKDAKTFDFLEGDKPSYWKYLGIRLDHQLYPYRLPEYQKPVDNGEPLKPLTLNYGQCKLTVDKDSSLMFAAGYTQNPVTGANEHETPAKDTYLISVYPAAFPTFLGPYIPHWDLNQFKGLLVAGETLTLSFDEAACVAYQHDFAAGKPDPRQCVQAGGSIGDLNQVLIDNPGLALGWSNEVPKYEAGQTFAEWSEQLWQNMGKLRQVMLQSPDYTRRQKDFIQLYIDWIYLFVRENYTRSLRYRMHPAADSIWKKLDETYTFIDPHAKDLQLYRDGRSYYLPLYNNYSEASVSNRLAYLDDNGLNHGEVYEVLKGMAESQAIAKWMIEYNVQSDSMINRVHPYFQPMLHAFYDSTRELVKRMMDEGEKRKRTAPDVPGDQLLQAIVNQYPGKVVFVDLWATWCGPCMRGIQAMEPLKKKLADRDVVFVYLTDESSRLNDWNKQVIDIPGEHYRVSSAVWKQIPNVPGIPKYYLYDSEGKRVWEHLGFGGDETLKDIEDAIRKAISTGLTQN